MRTRLIILILSFCALAAAITLAVLQQQEPAGASDGNITAFGGPQPTPTPLGCDVPSWDWDTANCFTTDGLWHRETSASITGMSGAMLAFNQGCTGPGVTGCTYSTGATVAGRAASPTFSAPTGAILTFKTARSTENECGFDRTFILFSQDGGASFSSLNVIGSITIGDQILVGGGEICGDSLTAQTVTALLPPGATNVAFDFDSVDTLANDFAGQFVDDVGVTPCPSEGCPAPPGLSGAVTIDDSFPADLLTAPTAQFCSPGAPCKLLAEFIATHDIGNENPQQVRDLTLIIPPAFHVAPGGDVINGNVVGSLSFGETFALFPDCSTTVPPASGQFKDGALPGETTDGADLLDPGKWPTALEQDPRVAALVASGHTVIRRAVATDLTVATIPIPINVLFFDVSDGNGFGGLTIAGTYAVVVIGPSDPPLTDVSCTPLTIDSVLFGETVGGQLLFRCDVGGPHTFAIVVTNSGSSAVAAIVKDNPNDCGPPFTPTPTPTVTPTPTPVPTSKPLPTPKVTPTPNATAIANGSLMTIDADCDETTNDTFAVALVGGSPIVLCIIADAPAAAGYQVRAEWNGAVASFNNSRPAADYDFFVENCNPPGGAVVDPPTVGASSFTLHVEGPQNASACLATKITELEFTCTTHASTNVTLTGPGSDTYFIDADEPTLVKPALGAAVIVCLNPDGDSDVDGCTNEAELQSKANAAAGGGRDPHDFWDFFDTWATGSRTRNIDGFDIGGVVVRFGTVSVPPLTKEEALAEALTPPTDTTGYHAAYDRDVPDPDLNVWNLGPPSGNIDGFDIAFVVVQFGHTCVVLP